MKAIPIITILLIGQTMFLNYVNGELGRLHLTVYKILPVVDRQLLSTNSHWLQFVGLSWFGFSLLSLALIVVIWRNRLCPRWMLLGIVLFWLIMFFSNLTGKGY